MQSRYGMNRRVHSACLIWRRGPHWPSPGRFDETFRTFSGLRDEAEQAKRAERSRTGLVVPPALLARAKQPRAFLTPSRQRALNAGA